MICSHLMNKLKLKKTFEIKSLHLLFFPKAVLYFTTSLQFLSPLHLFGRVSFLNRCFTASEMLWTRHRFVSIRRKILLFVFIPVTVLCLSTRTPLKAQSLWLVKCWNTSFSFVDINHSVKSNIEQCCKIPATRIHHTPDTVTSEWDTLGPMWWIPGHS